MLGRWARSWLLRGPLTLAPGAEALARQQVRFERAQGELNLDARWSQLTGVPLGEQEETQVGSVPVVRLQDEQVLVCRRPRQIVSKYEGNLFVGVTGPDGLHGHRHILDEPLVQPDPALLYTNQEATVEEVTIMLQALELELEARGGVWQCCAPRYTRLVEGGEASRRWEQEKRQACYMVLYKPSH